MNPIPIYLSAVKTFFAKLPRGFVELFKNELAFHRNIYTAVYWLRQGWTPEALARQTCTAMGAEVGSDDYKQLLKDAQDIKTKFKL